MRWGIPQKFSCFALYLRSDCVFNFHLWANKAESLAGSPCCSLALDRMVYAFQGDPWDSGTISRTIFRISIVLCPCYSLWLLLQSHWNTLAVEASETSLHSLHCCALILCLYHASHWTASAVPSSFNLLHSEMFTYVMNKMWDGSCGCPEQNSEEELVNPSESRGQHYHVPLWCDDKAMGWRPTVPTVPAS